MLRRFFLILVTLSTTISYVSARQLTPDEALARLQSGRSRVSSKVHRQAPRLIHTVEADGLSLLYLFGDDQQKVTILGADDLLPEVFAYDVKGFDTEHMPANLKWWLESYKEAALQTLKSKSPMKVAALEADPIAPLIKTKWDQGAPYSNQVVAQLGADAPTGCMATCVAQLMKYWHYPAKGTGSHAYNCDMGGRLYVDFSSATYDWDSMLDTYGDYAVNGFGETGHTDYTEAQADAVAQLMYHCGVALNMDYAPEGSGASNYSFGNAMISYFGYDKGMKLRQRVYIDDEEWVGMIMDELRASRPIAYSGATKHNEGHIFICDGYDGLGYFHFNWGWSGWADGYYMITGTDPLHPVYHGLGGAASGGSYTERQAIYTGIRPAQSGSRVDAMMSIYDRSVGSLPNQYYLVLDELGQQISGNVYRGRDYRLFGNLFNTSVLDVTAHLGAFLRSVDTGKESVCYSQYLLGCEPGSGYSSIGFSFDEIEENGTFEVFPAYQPVDDTGRPLGEWRKVQLPKGAAVPIVKLTGQLPIMQVTDVKFTEDENGITENPLLTVTIKALANFSSKRISANVYEWDGTATLNTYSISSSLSMKAGETKTLENIKLMSSLPAKALVANKAYRIEIYSRNELGIGQVEHTKFNFYIGNPEADALRAIYADKAPTPSYDGYYDLQGRHIATPTRGLYIHDGKKVMVK